MDFNWVCRDSPWKKHFERKVYVMDLACGMFIGSCIVKQIQVMKYSKTCGSVFLWIVYRVLLSQDNFYNACITPLSMSIYQNPMNKQFMLWVGYTNCLSDTLCACAGFLSLSVNAYCVKFLYQIHHVRKCTALGSSWPQSLMRIAYYQILYQIHCVDLLYKLLIRFTGCVSLSTPALMCIVYNTISWWRWLTSAQ